MSNGVGVIGTTDDRLAVGPAASAALGEVKIPPPFSYPIGAQAATTFRTLVSREREATARREGFMLAVRDMLGIPADVSIQIDGDAGVVRIVTEDGV